MKAGWETKRLGDLVSRLTNGYVGPTRTIYQDEGVPYLLARHVKSNRLTFDGITFVTQAFNQKHKKSILKTGDVLLVQSGHVGHSAVVPPAHEGHNCHAMIVISPNPGQISSGYLSHFFDSPLTQIQFERIHTGATLKHLNCGDVKELQIPVPPLTEQRRIVGILDKAIEGIATAKANTEKSLQNAQAIFESRVQTIFTQRRESWVQQPLESVAKITNGYAFKSTDFSPSNNTRCIKITNVGIREFVSDSGGLLPNGFVDKYASVSVKSGDIVIALTRTIISGGLKVAIVPKEYQGALLNQRVASIRAKPKFLTEPFLFTYLSTQSVADYVKERVNTLMQPNLSIKDLWSMPIPIPSIHEQIQITDQISNLREQTQRLESIYQQKLTALDDLKKSLLHRAFSGEL